MSLLIAAALLLLPARVTIHARAQPLSLLLPTLSERIDRPLAVDQALAGEWLVIEAQDVDPDALLERIAEVTHAEWSQDSSGRYRLSRSPAREQALANEARSFVLGKIQRAFAPRTTPYDPARAAERLNAARARSQSEEPEAYLDLIVAQHESPANRALHDLAPRLPIVNPSRWSYPNTVTFSNHPTGSQRPLPPGVSPILKRLAQEWDLYRSHLTDANKATLPDRLTRATIKIEPGSANPGSFRVHFSLALRDDQGKSLNASQGVIANPPKIELPIPKDAKPFLPSPLSREHSEILYRPDSFRNASGPLGNSSPEVRDVLLHPERDGRLTRLWSDMMFAYAERESEALVANLPDHMEGFAPHRVMGQRLENYLTMPHGLEMRRDGGWITFRPRFPGPAGAARVDRAVLGRAVRRVAAGGGLTWDEGLAVKAGLGRNLNHFMPILRAADGSGAALRAMEGPPVGLEFFRHLSEADRTALYAGRRLAFSGLPKPAQDALRRQYLASTRFILKPEGEGKPSYGSDFDFTALVGPREVARLSIEAEFQEHPLFLSSFNPSSNFPRDAYGVGVFPPRDLRTVGASSSDRYRLGITRKLLLHIRFPHGYRQTFQITAHVFEPDSPFLTVAQFPPSIRDYLIGPQEALTE